MMELELFTKNKKRLLKQKQQLSLNHRQLQA